MQIPCSHFTIIRTQIWGYYATDSFKLTRNYAGKIPTVLLNDADAAIVAEVWDIGSKSRYQDAKNIAMITIGTGQFIFLQEF